MINHGRVAGEKNVAKKPGELVHINFFLLRRRDHAHCDSQPNPFGVIGVLGDNDGEEEGQETSDEDRTSATGVAP